MTTERAWEWEVALSRAVGKSFSASDAAQREYWKGVSDGVAKAALGLGVATQDRTFEVYEHAIRSTLGDGEPDRSGRVPPGQKVTTRFPVLTAGPIPEIDPKAWKLALRDRGEDLANWTLEDLRTRLPRTEVTADFHCVTGWSTLDVEWTGVSIDDLLAAAGARPRTHLRFVCEGGYDTTIPYQTGAGAGAVIAYDCNGKPLETERGGPARAVVPALYGWKSAKWVTGVELIDGPGFGFWEKRGYHDAADPWREQRYWLDQNARRSERLAEST